MNIMIVGDDHGYDVFPIAYDDAIKRFRNVDMLIHTGDSECFDCEYYKNICKCQVHMVRGNNDFSQIPQECIVNVENIKMFVTHGHRYRVYSDIQTIAYAAQERNANIVIFGHTHHALHQKGNNIELINPGSLSGIRSFVKSYAMLIIKNGETKVHIVNY